MWMHSWSSWYMMRISAAIYFNDAVTNQTVRQDMPEKSPRPTEINLHQKSRILEISFDNGNVFKLPYEYLRVYSPSAEVRGHGPGQGVLQVGKEKVSITKIDPVGSYAIQPHFDDGHDTGIYSWETLYDLGVNHERYWKEYLESLEAAGHKRMTASTD